VPLSPPGFSKGDKLNKTAQRHFNRLMIFENFRKFKKNSGWQLCPDSPASYKRIGWQVCPESVASLLRIMHPSATRQYSGISCILSWQGTGLFFSEEESYFPVFN
jgi:hypothetical protein